MNLNAVTTLLDTLGFEIELEESEDMSLEDGEFVFCKQSCLDLGLEYDIIVVMNLNETNHAEIEWIDCKPHAAGTDESALLSIAELQLLIDSIRETDKQMRELGIPFVEDYNIETCTS